MEKVDILLPPDFRKSGKIKTIQQAREDKDWVGVFNLWVIQTKPTPSIIYQQRRPDSSWAPNKLDVSAGGYYQAGEEISDGLREVREELGKDYKFKDLTCLGRKLAVLLDTKGRTRQVVADIFMVIDNSPLSSYRPEKAEVYAICACPIDKLVRVHTRKGYRFETEGITNEGEKIKIGISKNSFPYNWDPYHFKIALLAERFVRGEKNLVY
ncbi:hypothetical protein FJZ40_02035 [Candidatus Shapirobacteria bacterium]|nr:hypothetical protein [Candidatus Shapirobacteria bacterium]